MQARRFDFMPKEFLLAAMVAGLAAGAVSAGPVRGLGNTAATFAVLWGMEKYCELHKEARWNGWVLVLILSLVTYRASLWLHDNPEFVAAMFL